MAAPPSIIDLKKSFLSTQIRTLNAPLEPPRDWRENCPAPDEGELKDKVVREVLQKCKSRIALLRTCRLRLTNLK